MPTTGATRIPNLQTGKADIIISTLSVTPERAKVIDFSKPYAALESVVGAPKDLAIKDWPDLKGKSVTVTRGTTQDTELSGDGQGPRVQVVRYDDDADHGHRRRHRPGRHRGHLADHLNQITAKNPPAPFEPKFVLRNFDLAIGVKKGEPRLLAKLNEWVAANLKNGKLNDIYKKYHGGAAGLHDQLTARRITTST